MSEQTNEQTLNLPKDHDVISKPMEQAMVDALKQSKKPRKRKQMHDYVEEVTQLSVSLHDTRVKYVAVQKLFEEMSATANEMVVTFEKPSIRFALGLLLKAIKQGRL